MSAALQPLLDGTDLRDVSEHPNFEVGEFSVPQGNNDRGIRTFGLGNDNQKIDYILLSPAFFDRVTSAGLWRKAHGRGLGHSVGKVMSSSPKMSMPQATIMLSGRT